MLFMVQGVVEFLMLLVKLLFDEVVDFVDIMTQLVQLRLDSRVLLDVFLDEHQDEADDQQQAGTPDGVPAKPLDADASQTGTQTKQEDDAEIVESFVLRLGVAGAHPSAEGFHAAPQVADAHGAGETIAVYLPEGLYLHGAGKGDDGIRQQVPLLWEETDCKQQNNLAQDDQLPPVERLQSFELSVQHLRGKNAQCKGQQGNEIMEDFIPLPGEQVVAQKNDVAGLGVGEYFSTEKVGISILQAARKRKKHGSIKGFGHLPVMNPFQIRLHENTPSQKILAVFV